MCINSTVHLVLEAGMRALVSVFAFLPPCILRRRMTPLFWIPLVSFLPFLRCCRVVDWVEHRHSLGNTVCVHEIRQGSHFVAGLVFINLEAFFETRMNPYIGLLSSIFVIFHVPGEDHHNNQMCSDHLRSRCNPPPSCLPICYPPTGSFLGGHPPV